MKRKLIKMMIEGPFKLSERDAIRVFSKIVFEGPDDCWMTTVSHNGKGYPQIGIKTDGKMRLHGIHRIICSSYYNLSLLNWCAIHSCDNPGCVNPKHLKRGTVQENNLDKELKGRASFRSLPGEESPNAKLTEKQVIEIKRRYKKGNITQLKLSKIFKVSSTNIGLIVRGINWKHVK